MKCYKLPPQITARTKSPQAHKGKRMRDYNRIGNEYGYIVKLERDLSVVDVHITTEPKREKYWQSHLDLRYHVYVNAKDEETAVERAIALLKNFAKEKSPFYFG